MAMMIVSLLPSVRKVGTVQGARPCNRCGISAARRAGVNTVSSGKVTWIRVACGLMSLAAV